jgi:hypothetical protein
MALVLWPCTITHARAFVSAHHRHLPKSENHRWAVRAIEAKPGQDDVNAGPSVAVAIVGSPARLLQEQGVLEVVRLAVKPGVKNACSLLYGACARAAKAMGATDLVTYTRLEEPGTSLVAAGWVEDGLTKGGEATRPSRKREPLQDARPKRRWWAPFGKRAQAITAARDQARREGGR